MYLNTMYSVYIHLSDLEVHAFTQEYRDRNNNFKELRLICTCYLCSKTLLFVYTKKMLASPIDFVHNREHYKNIVVHFDLFLCLSSNHYTEFVKFIHQFVS